MYIFLCYSFYGFLINTQSQDYWPHIWNLHALIMVSVTWYRVQEAIAGPLIAIFIETTPSKENDVSFLLFFMLANKGVILVIYLLIHENKKGTQKR